MTKRGHRDRGTKTKNLMITYESHSKRERHSKGGIRSQKSSYECRTQIVKEDFLFKYK